MKSVTLKQVADMAEGMFYQDLRAQDAFFEGAHFKWLCAQTYSTLLNKEFTERKLRNKMTEGFSFVEISPSWLVEEDSDVEKGNDGIAYFDTTNPIFSFDFDAMSSGLQMLRAVGKCCGDLIRISFKDKWQYCRAPLTKDSYFYQGVNRVELIGRACLPEKVSVWYVPALDIENNDSVMAEGMAIPVITTVLNLMFAAKNGEVVDMSNNANSNAQPATETDPSSIPKQ